jgi:4-hydroxy-3-methylbut-2-en-1-yl diphosphate reductase
MKVICASALGMCFGVRDAIRAAERVADPSEVTILGEIVHNPAVQGALERRGFRAVDESAGRDGLPSTPAVLVTAHGTSDRRRAELEASGRRVVDTTCPLVRHVHDCAQRFRQEGRFVVVIGKPGHVEVLGITGDLERFAVVEETDDVRDWGEPRIGIVCQSTTPPHRAAELRAAVAAANPRSETESADTICRPTKDRQRAVLELLAKVDILVVVGGRNSNNTRQLALLAESRGVEAMRVERAADLDRERLRRHRVAGLTAGTSTLDGAIHEVHCALLEVKPARNSRPTAAEAARAMFRACSPDEACL